MGRPKGSKNKGPNKNTGSIRADWKKRFGTDFKDIFYTYTWYRQKDFTPYYVGKGTGNRAFISDGHGVHRPISLACIVVQIWETKEKSLEMEKWWIAFWGRKNVGTGLLRNLTDGGEDPPVGRATGKRSEEVRKKFSEITKAKWKDPEYARHMSEVHKGQKAWNEGISPSRESIEKRLDTMSKKPLRTHCRKGHEYIPENTYVEPSGNRRCRTCDKIKNRNFWKRKKEKQDGTEFFQK